MNCRFCNSTDCEHGDHCAECGCPECGFPGARHSDASGVRGFCTDCDWEAVPGAYDAWKARQPVLSSHQMKTAMLAFLGAPEQPDDVVGPMLVLE
jgi:hypothetical protein